MADFLDVNKIKFFLKNNILICGGICLAFFINISFWIYLLSKLKFLNEPIITKYNVYFGAELMGSVKNILILPLVGSILLMLNTLLVFIVIKNSKIISHIVVYSLCLLQIFLFIAGISLVLVNM